MTQIFKCLAGSRLYGTNTPDSDTDFKAVHLPTKREILLGNRKTVKSTSTGTPTNRNGADDLDVESFELQRFLKLASDMQTIPVEMLFTTTGHGEPIWDEIIANRHKILSNNPQSFIGYCKGQAVRYSMRGDRLKTYEAVCAVLDAATDPQARVDTVTASLEQIEGVTVFEKEHCGKMVGYVDVYGRQVPANVKIVEAQRVYWKPVAEAGERARGAMESGGKDLKALYHAVRIADEGISLFRDGIIEFPCKNLEFLMQIRAGELELDAILDRFDEKLAILTEIGDNSPWEAEADHVWIDDFVSRVYEDIVRA